MEIIRLLVDFTRNVDPSTSPEFLRQIEGLSQGNEEVHIKRTVELMKAHEKPVIDVSLAGTDLGTVRPVPGKRYSGVFYQTPENAVKVLSKIVAYQRFLDQLRVNKKALSVCCRASVVLNGNDLLTRKAGVVV